MLFQSLEYGIFLPIVFGSYWITKDRFRWIILVIASYIFYMFSVPVYGILIFSVTLLSYIAAIIINKNENNKKIVLSIFIILLLCILFYFKYCNFFLHNLFRVLGIIGFHVDSLTLNIILPVGISFYIFQSIGYVVDVYRGEIEAEYHFGKYMAFVSFFPQLVAGPIERSKNLLPQIREEKIFDYNQATDGIRLMIWGYYKKLVIADVLAKYVEPVFGNIGNYTGFALLIAVLFFAIQIYCDFSGYSDIAIGTAKLFGIELMTNFKAPYFSSSIREFWNRWHISLSTWFKDYVYIPLGGNRTYTIRHHINTFVTFLISGLWHGANWTFAAWGAVHGFGRIIDGTLNKDKHDVSLPIKALKTIIVFTYVLLSWVLFASKSIRDAIYWFTHAFLFENGLITFIKNGVHALGLNRIDLIVLLFCIVILILYDYLIVLKGKSFNKHPLFRCIFYGFVTLLIVFLSEKGAPTEFIYFQF